MLRSFMHNNHSIAVAMIIVLYPRWPLEYNTALVTQRVKQLACAQLHTVKSDVLL